MALVSKQECIYGCASNTCDTFRKNIDFKSYPFTNLRFSPELLSFAFEFEGLVLVLDIFQKKTSWKRGWTGLMTTYGFHFSVGGVLSEQRRDEKLPESV